MLSKRSFGALTQSERQLSQFQWPGGGRSVRCFHSSLRKTARKVEGKKPADNDEGNHYNVPNRGPNRQQRAALVSQEVQMLQRDRPSPTFNNPDPDTLRPTGAARTVDPEAVGRNVAPGRMGQNDAPTKDGPLTRTQGATLRGGRSDVDAGVDTRAARSTGQPFTVEDSVERGGSGLEDGIGESNGARLGLPAGDEGDITLPIEQIFQTGTASTIAAAGFDGLVEERIQTVSEPGLSQAEKTNRPHHLLHKLKSGKLVRFESSEEKAAVLQAAKDVARRQSRPSRKMRSKSPASNDGTQDSESDEGLQTQTKVYKLSPLPTTVQDVLVGTLVRGAYDSAGVLSQDGPETPLLSRISKAALMNGTYLSHDRERLLRKVRSLLPAASSRR